MCASTYFACPTACVEQPDGGSSTDRVCRCPNNATSSDICSAASDGSGMECLPCPLGSRCDASGFTLCSLDLLPGYWRQANTSLPLRPCPDRSSSNSSSSGCQGGRGASPCKPELTGPYCKLCAEENMYYVGAKGTQVSTCFKCGTSRMSSEAAASLGVLVLAALIFFLAWKLRNRFKEAAFVHTEAESPKFAQIGPAANRVRLVVNRSWFKWLLVAGKLVVSFYQIVTEIPGTYLVTLPASVQQLLATFESLSLDLFRFVPLECIGFSNLHHKLLLHILTPLGLMALSPLLGLCLARKVEKSRRLQAVLMYALRVCLAVSWLFYPAICSLTFQAFNCETFEDGSSYLYADYSTACDANSKPPPELATTAWAVVLLYCVGVPLVYLLLLWHAHDAIQSGEETDLSKALAFLHDPFEVHFYWWEIFERLQALVLVGFIVLVRPGSLVQLVTGLMCALCFFMITIQAAPFKDGQDTFLCIGQKFSLVSFFVFCLVLKTVHFIEQVDEKGVLSSVMRASYLFEEDALTICLMCCIVGSLFSASLMFAHRLRITVTAQMAYRAEMKEREEELREARKREALLTAQLEEAYRAVQVLRPRNVPRLVKYSKGELKANGCAVLNEPGQWHVMVSYSQRARLPPQIAINLTSYLRAQGYLVWLDVSMLRKDVVAMQEAVENSMMVICILNSEKPGDEFAYFMRPFCRKEMRWALDNEEATGGMWSKIQPVVDVQDSRTKYLSSDLSDEHLRAGEDPASSMSREDVNRIVDRDFIEYNSTDAAYMAVAHKKIIRELEAMAADRLSVDALRENAAADEEAERVNGEGAVLNTELDDGMSHHVLLSFATDGTHIAEKLSHTLSYRGYKVCSLPISTDRDVCQAAIDAAVAVMPIICDEYLSGAASHVLQWAREKERVVQPLVHVNDKRKISQWMPHAPPYLRNKDWVDMHPGDADYWACGVIKLLMAMRDEADKPPGERHDGSGVAPVSGGPWRSGRQSGRGWLFSSLTRRSKAPDDAPRLPRPSAPSSLPPEATQGDCNMNESSFSISVEEKMRESVASSARPAEDSSSMGLAKKLKRKSTLTRGDDRFSNARGTKDGPGREVCSHGWASKRSQASSSNGRPSEDGVGSSSSMTAQLPACCVTALDC